MLLCEAVVAVYVSLLIHALATDSSTELFRLAAHPLNNRMWAAVFGGGVKLVVKPRKPPESVPGTISTLPIFIFFAFYSTHVPNFHLFLLPFCAK